MTTNTAEKVAATAGAVLGIFFYLLFFSYVFNAFFFFFFLIFQNRYYTTMATTTAKMVTMAKTGPNSARHASFGP